MTPHETPEEFRARCRAASNALLIKNRAELASLRSVAAAARAYAAASGGDKITAQQDLYAALDALDEEE